MVMQPGCALQQKKKKDEVCGSGGCRAQNGQKQKCRKQDTQNQFSQFSTGLNPTESSTCSGKIAQLGVVQTLLSTVEICGMNKESGNFYMAGIALEVKCSTHTDTRRREGPLSTCARYFSWSTEMIATFTRVCHFIPTVIKLRAWVCCTILNKGWLLAGCPLIFF